MIKNCLIPNKNNSYKPYLLRKIAIVAYSLILVFVNSFGGILGIQEATASSITPQNIISLTNKERTKLGLQELSNNSRLASAALAKANDMLEKQYWDHFGPNGETPWQFIRAAGYVYIYAGENLAKGFKTSEGVVEAWMASPTHKANIVSANYRDIGVAVVNGVLLGKETTLVVQMFGTLAGQVESAKTTTPVPATVTPPPPPTTTKIPTKTATVSKVEEQIKSISITAPANGITYNDPNIEVSGKVENINNEYTVEVIEGESVIGGTTSSTPDWSVKKDSDWSEGDHTIKANIKGTTINSQTVTFNIDSTPPQVDVDSVEVVEDDEGYVLSFSISEEFESVEVISGSKIIPVEVTTPDNITVALQKEEVGDRVLIRLSDKHENDSELDISDYFKKEEPKKSPIPVVSLSVGNGISLGIVLFVFVLLCIEIFVYVKKGMFKNAVSDILTLGIWWSILAIAIFSGFSGKIS